MPRWHSPRDESVRLRRFRCALRFEMPTRQNFRKRHPHDCGQTRCATCHPDKCNRSRRPTRQERASRLRLVDGVADLD